MRRLAATLVLLVLISGCTAAPAETTSTLPPTTAPTTTTEATTTSLATTTTLPPLQAIAAPGEACNFGIPQPSRWAVFADPGDDSDDWVLSTPEEQEMDSSVLLAGWPDEEDSVIRSLLVIRNDTIVAEGYFNGRAPDEAADVYSASKSVLSALIGIAIEEGFIGDVDDPVSEYLPRLFATLDDPAKSEVTLRHLLTMTAGLEWQTDPDVDYTAVYTELDWLDGFWSYPLLTEPGADFNYNTGLTHTLSAVLTSATGMSTCDFATEYLFDPLGITVELWTEDPFGYFVGGSGVFLTPREMAKFGLLYLHDGEWNGEQIVPPAWVEESTQPHVAAGGGSYGYLWWPETIRGYETYAARGFGGQTILVIPELDVVVVTTGADDHDLPGTRSFSLQEFIASHVIPSTTG